MSALLVELALRSLDHKGVVLGWFLDYEKGGVVQGQTEGGWIKGFSSVGRVLCWEVGRVEFRGGRG
eukprot:756638-Hanusia_phi.AAC.5